jgi:hypothetical protein
VRCYRGWDARTWTGSRADDDEKAACDVATAPTCSQRTLVSALPTASCSDRCVVTLSNVRDERDVHADSSDAFSTHPSPCGGAEWARGMGAARRLQLTRRMEQLMVCAWRHGVHDGTERTEGQMSTRALPGI